MIFDIIRYLVRAAALGFNNICVVSFLGGNECGREALVG